MRAVGRGPSSGLPPLELGPGRRRTAASTFRNGGHLLPRMRDESAMPTLRRQIEDLARTYVKQGVTIEELQSPRLHGTTRLSRPMDPRARAQAAMDAATTQPLPLQLDSPSRLRVNPDGSPSKRVTAGMPSRPEFYPAPPAREDNMAATGFDPSARLAAFRQRPERPGDLSGGARLVSTGTSGLTSNPYAAKDPPKVVKPSSQSSSKTDPLAPFGLRTLGPIAAGAFSTVVRALRANGGGGGSGGGGMDAEVAVKSFNRVKYQREPWLKESLKSELEVLGMLQSTCHPHVANLLSVHEATQATHAVLEYCSGGSVHRHLRSLRHGHGLSEPHAALVVHQLITALAHLHSHQIAHRDVKPENVLYTDGARRSVKLCDFGFALHCGKKLLKTVCGSPAYMAPELCTKGAYLGPPVDVWALGCFAFEALHGLCAFRASDMATLQLRIKRCDHTPFSKTLSLAVQRAVRSLLVVDAEQRPSADASVQSWEALRRAPDADASVDRRQALPAAASVIDHRMS